MQLDPDRTGVLEALLAMQRHSWEQGVAGHAALDLGLRDVAARLATSAIVRQADWGGLGEMGDDGAMNGPANGEAVLLLAERGDAAARQAVDRQLHWLTDNAPRADDGTLFHLRGSRAVWVDTVYMVVPFLVLMGESELAERQLSGHRERLWDKDSGLYAARWDEDAQRLNAPQHWGTGNGWVVAGIARSLRHGRLADGWAQHARQVIDACVAHRDEGGAFHDVIDDPASFDEVNLAQMLAYAAATGAADGWLPGSYAELARDLMSLAVRHVGEDGYVRPVCGSPNFDRPGISAEAQAMHLLAWAAVRRA